MRDRWNVTTSHGHVLLRASVRSGDESREVLIDKAEAFDEDADKWVDVDSHPLASGTWAEDAMGEIEAEYLCDRRLGDRKASAIDAAFDADTPALRAYLNRTYGESPLHRFGAQS